MRSHPWNRGLLPALRTTFAIGLALCTSAGITAAGSSAPIIDGNGDDLIAFASATGATNCVVNVDDARDDVVIADPKIVVCAPREDTSVPPDGITDYFINGFDLRKFVLVYDRPNRNLYILWRTEGAIGDPDGNLNPDQASCIPAATFADEPGIGSQENYQARLDTNCDGIPDVIIGVGGTIGVDLVSVQGASFGSTQLAYRQGAGTGRDLEVSISNINLPLSLEVQANVNASFDGLGEDVSAEATCGIPNPSIDLQKSVNPPVICTGGTADFTLVTTNTGNVDLTGVTVVDNLPAGLVYQSTQSNTCGGAVNASGSQITYGPFNLAAGASCTIVLRVGRTAECSGDQVNNASVEGSFQSACFNGGNATTVTDEASATVRCGSIQCAISAPDTQVCGTETVQICGPEGSYTYLWSTGATTRCITVGVGTYSLVVTDPASGCQSTNPCSVTVTADQPPVCSIPPATVCPGETTELCGPEGAYTYLWNTGATTRCITVGAGTYSLTITSTTTGCASSSPCSVTVTEDPNRPECVAPSCPRTVGFWGQQCAQKNDGSTKFDRSEMDQITACVDATSSFFSWSNDFDGFCSIINPGKMDQRKQAKRQYAGMLANVCTGQLGLVPSNGNDLFLDPNTPIHCEGFTADTVGELITEIDALLAELEGQDLSNGSVKAAYTSIIGCTGALNEGTSIHTTPGCEHSGIPSGSSAGGTGEASTLDVYGIELYRAFPNPFNTTTQFAYEVEQEAGADVEVTVYDVAGRQIRKLVTGLQPAGRQVATWDGRSDAGVTVTRGVYFVRTVIDGTSAPIQRVLFVR